MFDMKPEYLTGIDEIDKEHKELFRIAKTAYDLHKNEFVIDKFDRIVAIIEELKEYTKTHFSHEEAYMKKIGYRKIFSHVIEHHSFIEKLDSIDFEKMDRNQSKSLLDLLAFLSDWLIHHILEVDKKIG